MLQGTGAVRVGGQPGPAAASRSRSVAVLHSSARWRARHPLAAATALVPEVLERSSQAILAHGVVTHRRPFLFVPRVGVFHVKHTNCE